MSEELDLMWAKSDTNENVHDTSTRPHRILAHLTDTSEVAGVMWDEWLAPIIKARIEAMCPPGSGMTGRNLVRWLAGVHDIGKISPAFQMKCMALAHGLGDNLAKDAAGISKQDSRDWRHTLAGGRFILDALRDTAWHAHAAWISSVIGGHHGLWDEASAYRVRGSEQQRRHGGDAWEQLRQEALARMTRATGIADQNGRFFPMTMPGPADVVLLTAIVIVADWVASNGQVMPGIWGQDRETTAGATQRAQSAWRALRMHAGWDPDSLLGDEPFAARFPQLKRARPVQRLAAEMASDMPRSGLMIVEAPMGEGKTELSLAVAEILAKRFGCDGVFFGLPTQATADAILDRFTPWLGSVSPGSPVALAHGKAMINETMLALPQWAPAEIGIDCCESGLLVTSVSSWFRSAKRLLLSPFVVGTIDNVLLAGAKTRHGCLRLLGLAGKVVILDEVHAADIYMSQFLERALSWLGSAGVPVILMSATLPSSQRLDLIEAYAGLDSGMGAKLLDDVEGYPRITLAMPATPSTSVIARSPADRDHSGAATKVRVRILHEENLRAHSAGDANTQVADLLGEQLRGGGCALVIRNTVGRAQSLHALLTERFPDATVVLFHSRFTAGHKEAIAKRVLARLGDSTKDGVRRPAYGEKFILVATQVAEQSLDIDADLLVTDLCPIDLLLQRVGRMWRHGANTPHRPAAFQEPVVWVTRMHSDPGDYVHPHPPSAIYPVALLTRTAHLVQRLDGGTIRLPDDIPALVAEVYERTEMIPESADEDAGYDRDQKIRETTAKNAAIRAANATGIGINRPAAHGLNTATTDSQWIMVRDGAISVEAVVLSQMSGGGYRLHTVPGKSGTPPALAGDGRVARGDMATVAKIVASTVRIPKSAIVGPVLELATLPSWTSHPWLGEARVLVLDANDETVLSHTGEDGKTRDYDVSYSSETGLSWSMRGR